MGNEQGRAALRRTEPGQRKASQGLLVLQRNQVSGSPVSAMAKTKLNPRAKPAATGDPRLREAQQRRLYAMSLHQLATEIPADTVNKEHEATCYGQIERRLVDNEEEQLEDFVHHTSRVECSLFRTDAHCRDLHSLHSVCGVSTDNA